MSTTYYKHRDDAGVVHVAAQLAASESVEEYDRRIACREGFLYNAEQVPKAEKGAVITCLTCLAVTDRPLRQLLG